MPTISLLSCKVLGIFHMIFFHSLTYACNVLRKKVVWIINESGFFAKLDINIETIGLIELLADI